MTIKKSMTMTTRNLKQKKVVDKISIRLSTTTCRNLLSFLDRAVELYADELDGLEEMSFELNATSILKNELQKKLNLL